MKFRNIIFDFDGTLVDSRPGIIASFQKMANKLTVEKIDDETIAGLIGLPLRQIVSVLLKTTDQNLINDGSMLYKRFYGEDGINQGHLYPGIKEMLLIFRQQSLNLFIASNKIEEFVCRILERYEIKYCFKDIKGTSGEDTQSQKSGIVHSIMLNYNLNKTETAIIGDTESDILAGKANSIYSIGITWGYRNKQQLADNGADRIFDLPSELGEFIINKVF